jgi:hypothetical protein
MAFITPGTVIAGEVLTAARWNQDVVANTDALYSSMRRLGYRTRSTDFTTASNTFAGAADLFTPVTFTADGTSEYVAHCFVPYLFTQAPTRYGYLGLDVDNAENGFVVGGNDSSFEYYPWGLHVWRFTPSAGSRDVTFRAYDFGGAVVFNMGAQGAAQIAKGFMAIYGPDIT